MPVPAAAIPAAAKLLSTAATRATGQALSRGAAKGATNAASKAGSNALAKSSAKTASSVCKQTGATRMVAPKKLPSRLATPANLGRPSGLAPKPMFNKLPSSQQMLNFCNKAFQKADQFGILDMATELGTNALLQKLTSKPSETQANGESGANAHNDRFDIVNGESSAASDNSHPVLSAVLNGVASSVLGQIQHALSEHQNTSQHSANFSEPTINLDENGLRR
ncbi:hypothetical protein TDB9533_00057 [Thalassocella blandensis]|nr:hypothetical protein TDB9533_00057 [Thalassocella blandensis]